MIAEYLHSRNRKSVSAYDQDPEVGGLGNYQKPQRTNIVSPELLFGHLWMQEQESNGVKIIELDSNSSNNDVNDSQDEQTFSHAWSYINQDRFRIPEPPKNDYKVNYKARENHRHNTTRYRQEAYSPENDRNFVNNSFFHSNFQESVNNLSGNENCSYRRQTGSFRNTNSYPKTPDSSIDVEYIDRSDLKENTAWNADDRYYDEILTYDPNLETEKRTIYIYSFKNKHLFTDNDGTNVSKSSSTSTNVGDEQINDKSYERIPSPIPDMYVPKLNLLQPPNLPTVTEITEPNGSDENSISKYDAKKPNVWFPYHSYANREKEFDCRSNNIISWMSLSPRKKCQSYKSRVLCENCRNQSKFQILREVSPIAEEDAQNMNNVTDPKPVLGDMLKVDGKNSKIDDRTQFNNDNTIVENLLEDRGDHLHNKSFQKIKIRINPKTSIDPTKITEPIEKLGSNNWIGDETIVSKHKSSNQLQIPEAVQNECSPEGDVSRRLWENNMVLLKPAEWSAFYPVESSVPSLHLSIETEIEEVTWFRRIIRCLKCFK